MQASASPTYANSAMTPESAFCTGRLLEVLVFFRIGSSEENAERFATRPLVSSSTCERDESSSKKSNACSSVSSSNFRLPSLCLSLAWGAYVIVYNLIV